MRIAQIAPLYEDVPPRTYGGTERVVAALCDSLVDAGHEVTLFATGSSRTRARLNSVVSAPLRHRLGRADLDEVADHLHLRMLADVYRQAGEFDVIHAHTDLLTLPFVDSVPTPTVMTLHGRLDTTASQRVLPMYPGAMFVSISDHQRLAVRDLAVEFVATVPNGLDLGAYHAQQRGGGDDLVFIGRVNAEKRPDIAVEVARRTGRRLRVAAKIDPFDEAYYAAEIEHLFAEPHVEFVGEVGEDRKPEFYASAAATLFPSDWPEPFGLVLLESLAAGTPVIALRRGAVPEILEDGVSGFICDTVDEMVAAVSRIGEIDPAACRRRALDFDVERMRQGYEAVYDLVRERDSRLVAPD